MSPDECYDDGFHDEWDDLDGLDPNDPDNYDPVDELDESSDEQGGVAYADYDDGSVYEDCPEYDTYNDPDNF